MQTWEYKTFEMPFTRGWSSPGLDTAEFGNTLTQLGREGWELVSIVTTHLENGRSGDLMAVFKRPGG